MHQQCQLKKTNKTVHKFYRFYNLKIRPKHQFFPKISKFSKNVHEQNSFIIWFYI